MRCTALLLLALAAAANAASFSNVLQATSPAAQLMECPALRPRDAPAKDINDLRVDDIKVVMALGDSTTAGFGVLGKRGSIFGDFLENRGLSWIMGGDDGASTVANFIARYNPNLIGRSVKDHLAEICYGPICPPWQYRSSKDVFNAAQSGAVVANLDHELSYLLKELKQNKKVDMANDWKMLNIQIGDNDLCLACYDITHTFLTADKFEAHIREIITSIQKSIPKTIVTLTEIFHVSEIFDLSLTSPVCSAMHRNNPIECGCAFNESPAGERTRATMDAYAREYNERLGRIVRDYQAQKLSDFAVVLAPQFRDADIKNFPIEFLSNIDCFHIAKLGAEAMAVAHFNNLFRPASEKKVTFEIGEPIECISEEARIQTL